MNVLALNWGKVAINMNYFYSAGHVTAVGKATASALEKLTDVLNLNVLHVIGHSLGAHVAGQIGRSLNVTLGRITGEWLKVLQEGETRRLGKLDELLFDNYF